MRSLKTIAEMQKAGKRKYMNDLIQHILPSINEGLTYAEIISELKNTHGIELTQSSISRSRKTYTQKKLDKIQDNKAPNSIFKDAPIYKSPSGIIWSEEL